MIFIKRRQKRVYFSTCCFSKCYYIVLWIPKSTQHCTRLDTQLPWVWRTRWEEWRNTASTRRLSTLQPRRHKRKAFARVGAEEEDKLLLPLGRNQTPQVNKSIPLAPAASVSGAVATGRTWAICRAMPWHCQREPSAGLDGTGACLLAQHLHCIHSADPPSLRFSLLQTRRGATRYARH